MLLTVLLYSCAEGGARYDVYLTIADPPQNLVRNAEFIDHLRLNWFDHHLQYRQKIIPAPRTLRPSEWPSIVVSISKHIPTPIVLTPVAVNGTRFSPAAAVFPITDTDGVGIRSQFGTLRWSEGCAIALLLRAFPHTDGLHGFNIRRYLAATAALPPDEHCWLDDVTILSLLQKGTMRISAIRTRPLYSTRGIFPMGSWVPTDASRPVVVSDGRTTQETEMPYGIFHFFDPDSDGYIRLLSTEQELQIVQSTLQRDAGGRFTWKRQN